MSERNDTPIFTPAPEERRFPATAVGIAAAAAIILVVFAVLMTRGHKNEPPPNTLQPPAAYASSLVLSKIQLSESSSFSGAKAVYIDGHIANHGAQTLTGATVQVAFPNDLKMPPQIVTLPMNRISMRDPYIDTEPFSQAPLAPNAEADFRLTLDSIYESWNQQQPELRIIRVSTK